MFKSNRIFSLLTVLIVTALLGSTMGVLPASAGTKNSSDEVTQPANVSITVFPANTVPITRLIYIWTGVSGATKYGLQVDRGNTRILDNEYSSSICASGTCSIKPAKLLVNGTYTWRVRAYVNGAYQPFSAWQSFVVALPVADGFYSPFTTDAADWVVHKGTWSLEGGSYFVTNGVAGVASTISHKGDFSTLTYQVRMKRDGCAGCANVIAIRGNPVLDSGGWWESEYTFDYTNNGLFSVWKDNNGSYTALKNWTYSSAINKGGWNMLKVTANGSQMKFYINDVLVWSGIDSAYSSGVAGIGMYRSSSSSGDKLWVDWAELEAVVSTATNTEVEDSGSEAGGGDRNVSP
jgi:hypothetical protein